MNFVQSKHCVLKKDPLVTIGLPVYNGEKYIKSAIDSAINQTFTDFELIISDNASTDRTRKICEEYASRDNRIRYFRLKKNLGASANFNNVFHMARGKYFKWAAHDDIYTPQYIELCVSAMQADPNIVLCQSNVKIIDENGSIIENHPHRSDRINLYLQHISSEEPNMRFADLIQYDHPCIDIFGLIRTQVLRETKLIEPIISSDRLLLAVLSLKGKFHRIPQYLFFVSNHDKRSCSINNRRALINWFDTKKKAWLALPHWLIFLKYLNVTARSNITAEEKFKCYRHILSWLIKNHKRLIMDLKILVKDITANLYIAI